MLGTYPTPVVALNNAAAAAGVRALYCKRDDLTSDVYGGNKVRKLERLLEEARAKGARKIVTAGAAGSHHVLATAIFGARAGFEVEAVLAPQTATAHAEEVARVVSSLGIATFPVRSFAAIPIAIAKRVASRKTFLIQPGGSSVSGTMAYVDAATELREQIDRGDAPRPTTIVVALGSGGTAAGLLVGLEREGLLVGSDGKPPIEVVAVQVVDPPFGSAAATLALALSVRRRLGAGLSRSVVARMSRSLRIVRAFRGPGYGTPTREGERATELAALDGIGLDPTYTAKTFAAALAEAAARPGPVLFWHTLSAVAPFERLLETAPPHVDPRIRGLFRAAAPETP